TALPGVVLAIDPTKFIPKSFLVGQSDQGTVDGQQAMAFPKAQVWMLAISVNDLDDRLFIEGDKSGVAKFQSRLTPSGGRGTGCRQARVFEKGVQMQLQRTNRSLQKKKD